MTRQEVQTELFDIFHEFIDAQVDDARAACLERWGRLQQVCSHPQIRPIPIDSITEICLDCGFERPIDFHV